jgi:DNA-binding NtrC family response regulator
MKMPDIDGLVLQTEINKTHPGIPIVFVSGFLTKDVVIKAIQHGAFSVIEKPFRYEQVIQTCSQAVKHSLALGKLEKTVRNLEQIIEKYKVEGLRTDFQEVMKSFSTQVHEVVVATFELKNEN